MVDATLACDGQSAAGLLRDISEHGCFAVTTLRCVPGRPVDVTLSRFGTRLRANVVEQTEDGMHLAFAGEGLRAADADRISLTTMGDFVVMTKNDHVAFVKRVVDAVTARNKLTPESLATSHHCRLGRWYDSVSDPATRALPSFTAIDAPHHKVHDSGRQALAALAADDMAAAQRRVSEMQQHSATVLRCLDEFGRAYPATIGADNRSMAIAA